MHMTSRTVLVAYQPPESAHLLGRMTLAAVVSQEAPRGLLVGSWFDGQAHDRAGLPKEVTVLTSAQALRQVPVLGEAEAWLSRYLVGHQPGPLPALAPAGTDFQRLVWHLLSEVPSGGTTTYSELARQVAQRRGRVTSLRAVGAAVGRNPLSVIVPCHRVVGADGTMTGYAGGVERKRWLLAHEGAVAR